MYDEIFKVFEVIKSHCHKNGNKTFEEFAVFELLENLFPVHGATQTIAIVTDMLDAQRIRDFGDSSSDSKVEILESDKSNDDVSIIELEVPRKTHPLVDLTNNSPRSDDSVIIESSNNQDFKNSLKNDVEIDSSSGISDYESRCSNDPDEEWWNDVSKLSYNCVKEPDYLPNYCSTLAELNKTPSNQLPEIDNNFSTAEEREISEMLEENNNDPNNNLDGGILDEEPINNNGNVLPEIIEPVPSCSKDIDNCETNDNSLPWTIACHSTSPIPGCSKDIDNLNVFEPSFIFENESIQKDAICIQEIIPWANLNTIHTILKKHGNSPIRKQLTLWDLMSEVSSQTNNKVIKRKQSNDLCKIPKKSPKTEDKKSPKTDDIDELSLDLPSIIEPHNNTCNESSNDSQSSRISECNESSSEIIDRNQRISDTESPKTLSLSKRNSSNSNHSTDSPEKCINNLSYDHLIDEAVNLMPDEPTRNPFLNKFTNIQVPKSNQNYSLSFTGLSVKKERNETIVSGSLLSVSSNSNANTNEINGNNDMYRKNISEEPLNKSTPVTETEIKRIKRELQDVAHFFQNDKPFYKDTTSEASNVKVNATEIIKPSKLIVQDKWPIQVLPKPATYIRPSSFFNAGVGNSNINQQKIVVRKDLGYQNQKQINIKPATITQPNQLLNRPIQLSSQHTKDKLMVNSGTFPTIIDNPFAGKPKNEPVLNIKPVKAAAGWQVVVQDSNRASTLVTQQPYKPIAAPKLKYLQSAAIWGKAPSITLTGPTKVQPTATITSCSMPAHVLSATNKPSITGAVQKIPPPRSADVPDRHIYNKLCSIFPEVKKSYVKKICINPPDGANYNNKEHVLNILVDHLLREGQNHLRRIDIKIDEQQENIDSTLSVDGKYDYLLEIFPDADPTYLRSFVKDSCPTEQTFQQFIQQKLEKRDYPTKEQYLAKIKITEQIKQYTTDFKVEKFLELFPDPFKHFEDPNRKCEYQPIATEFLKAFFNKNKVNTISRQYLRSSYNLSLAAKALSELGQDMKSKRMSHEMPTENIPLLQEMVFVKNKQNIKEYIDTLKKKEEELFKTLQEKNLLLTCQCCFNDECLPTKSSECNNGHIFCFDCIIRGTESKLADGEAHVKCFTNCESEFPLATLQKVLPPTTFSAILRKRQTAEIMAAGMDDLVSCPFCHFASIPPPEDKIFKCLNPECMKETCRQCKELNHIPLRCNEVVKNDKARRIIEEKMTAALLRTCYNCKKPFYKEEGCNKMQCNCGAFMCYLCDKPVQGYSHFNPQGGTNMHLCPLWSDDRRLNAEAVRKVAEEMKIAMQQVNPNLQIDMDSLLPKLPPRTKGAHDDIPNANELPEHVRRVAAP